MKTYLDSLCISGNLNCGDLPEYSHYEGGIFVFFICGFLVNDLNMVYRTLYDASTSSFFDAIIIYFYLLVLHYYMKIINYCFKLLFI